MTKPVHGTAPVPPEWLRSLLRSLGTEPPTLRETLDVSRTNGPRDAVMAIVARTRELEATTRERLVYVEWELAANPEMLRQLRAPRVAADLLAQVRGAARRDAPTLWTTSITPIPSGRTMDDWSQRRTPMGDFVRELGVEHETREWSPQATAALAERLNATPEEIAQLVEPDPAPVSPWTPSLLDLVLATLEPELEESR